MVLRKKNSLLFNLNLFRYVECLQGVLLDNRYPGLYRLISVHAPFDDGHPCR